MKKRKIPFHIYTFIILIAFSALLIWQTKIFNNTGPRKQKLITRQPLTDNPSFLTTATLTTTTFPPGPSPTNPADQIPKGKFYAPILTYHHIALRRSQDSYYVSPEIFEEQMGWLKNNHFTVISYDQFYNATLKKASLPEKPVVLTFDDGNLDQYQNAFPILKKYNYPAIFFINTDPIGRGGKMTWPEINEMFLAGMTIGSHTLSHPNLTKIKNNQLERELTKSKFILEQKLNTKINHFAYPGGSYNDQVIKAAQKAGYLSATTTHHKVFQEIKDNLDLFKLPRVHVDDELPTFIDWIQNRNLK